MTRILIQKNTSPAGNRPHTCLNARLILTWVRGGISLVLRSNPSQHPAGHTAVTLRSHWGGSHCGSHWGSHRRITLGVTPAGHTAGHTGGSHCGSHRRVTPVGHTGRSHRRVTLAGHTGGHTGGSHCRSHCRSHWGSPCGHTGGSHWGSLYQAALEIEATEQNRGGHCLEEVLNENHLLNGNTL